MDRQNQLSVCLHLLPPNLGQVKFIWEDTIQSESMDMKFKERLPPRWIPCDLKWVATSVNN